MKPKRLQEIRDRVAWVKEHNDDPYSTRFAYVELQDVEELIAEVEMLEDQLEYIWSSECETL